MNKKLKLKELGRMTVEEFQESQKIPVCIVLDNIRSGHNVGSVFRTSDAYRIERIYLCGITAQPPQPDITKTAIGATDSVSWEYYEDVMDCLEQLKKEDYLIASIEQTSDSVPVDELDLKSYQKIALVLGNEVKGVQQKVIDKSDLCIELPQYGTKHSLNVSVCAGILIWEVQKFYL